MTEVEAAVGERPPGVAGAGGKQRPGALAATDDDARLQPRGAGGADAAAVRRLGAGRKRRQDDMKMFHALSRRRDLRTRPKRWAIY